MITADDVTLFVMSAFLPLVSFPLYIPFFYHQIIYSLVRMSPFLFSFSISRVLNLS